MRKLRGEISAQEAANAAVEHLHEMAECKKSSTKYDITQQQFMCLHCYWSGEREFLHNAAAFGVCKPSEMLPKLLMDGAWTRCEHCRKKIPQAQLSADRAADADVSDVLKSQALEQVASIEAGMEKLKCVVCKKDKIQSEYHHDMWRM